jgi:hypothetical protein
MLHAGTYLAINKSTFSFHLPWNRLTKKIKQPEKTSHASLVVDKHVHCLHDTLLANKIMIIHKKCIFNKNRIKLLLYKVTTIVDTILLMNTNKKMAQTHIH